MGVVCGFFPLAWTASNNSDGSAAKTWKNIAGYESDVDTTWPAIGQPSARCQTPAVVDGLAKVGVLQSEKHLSD